MLNELAGALSQLSSILTKYSTSINPIRAIELDVIPYNAILEYFTLYSDVTVNPERNNTEFQLCGITIKCKAPTIIWNENNYDTASRLTMDKLLEMCVGILDKETPPSFNDLISDIDEPEEDKIEKLEEDNIDLKNKLSLLEQDLDSIKREKQILTNSFLKTMDEFNKLKDALLIYGSHKTNCPCLADQDGEYNIPCTCGFSDVLNEETE